MYLLDDRVNYSTHLTDDCITEMSFHCGKGRFSKILSSMNQMYPGELANLTQKTKTTHYAAERCISGLFLMANL